MVADVDAMWMGMWMQLCVVVCVCVRERGE